MEKAGIARAGHQRGPAENRDPPTGVPKRPQAMLNYPIPEIAQLAGIPDKQLIADSRLSELRRILLAWWKVAQRDFPWRHTREPYHIFVAEVLLHRTRAAQVAALYHNTLIEFPTLDDLAKTNLEHLARILHSAGLRWRVTLLLSAAQDINARFGGRIPRDSAQLQSIPGIGHYIASAIRCFAYGEADAIVDTNTVRVLGRVFGLRITDSLRRSRQFHELARIVLDPQYAREFNFALLDLAAMICTPRNPQCIECPIQAYCSYGGGAPPIQSAATAGS